MRWRAVSSLEFRVSRHGPGGAGDCRQGAAKGGFALLDLMISVLILGLFLVPLAIARNNVILMTGDIVSLRKARVLAAQKIGELELVKPEELTDGSGNFGDQNPGFLWETRVEVLPLKELVDLREEVEEEEGGFTSTLADEAAEEVQEMEVIRLTLVVRHTTDPDAIPFEEEVFDEDEGPKARSPDRIVIVRCWLKEPEEEDALAGSGG